MRLSESLVEEVIDSGGEQESVLAVEALLVRAVAPGLGVTGDQVFGPLDFRHATGALDREHVRAELSLPPAREHEGLPLRLGDRSILLEVDLYSSFPLLERWRARGAHARCLLAVGRPL